MGKEVCFPEGVQTNQKLPKREAFSQRGDE